jgi:hypothetical protein
MHLEGLAHMHICLCRITKTFSIEVQVTELDVYCLLGCYIV